MAWGKRYIWFFFLITNSYTLYDLDMWLGYIKLLVQLGQIDKAAQIHWKASKRIEDFATLASITAD